MRTNLKPPVNAVYRFGNKQSAFITYLKTKYSEYTVYRTVGYVQSKLVCETLQQIASKSIIYDVQDTATLNKLLSAIRESEQDQRLHKVYSSAVHRYINFLQA